MDGAIAQGGAAASETGRAKVFVSYSRRDAVFADRLAAALVGRNFHAFVDKQDIAPGEPWQERLAGLIAQADTVAFVVSPDSCASPVCGWEIGESSRLGKRILPVVCRRVPDAAAPPALARLNFIFATPEDDPDRALDLLEQALLTDLAWVREHTRLTEVALHWEQTGRGAAQTLRGADLDAAERWLSHRPGAASQPTELHRALIAASRRGARRRARAWVAGALTVAAMALVLAGYAELSRRRAEAALQAARGTANTFVDQLALNLRDRVGMPAGLVKDILGPALALQDRLLASGFVAPALREDQSHSLAVMAETLRRIGDTRGALPVARQAVEVLHRVIRDGARDDRARLDLADADALLGVTQLALGDGAAAGRAFAEELAVAQGLYGARADRFSGHALAIALQNNGKAAQAAGDQHAALAAYAQEVAVSRAVRAAHDGPDERTTLLYALGRLGGTRLVLGDQAGANAAITEELALARVMAADPQDARAQADLAGVLRAAAINVDFARDPQAALARMAEAVGTLRAIAAADPQNMEVRRDLAITLLGSGQYRLRAGQTEAALADLTDALAAYRLLATPAAGADGQLDLAHALIHLGLARAGAGAARADWIGLIREATAIYDRLRTAGPLPPDDQVVLDQAHALLRGMAGAAPGR